jgi:pilus assembly protein Flp/PilA
MDKVNVMVMRLLTCVKNEDGVSLMEYALLGGLIAVVALGAVTLLGTNVNLQLGAIAAAI